MSKCVFCSKENEGLICKHCLSKKASSAGSAIKQVGKIAVAVVPLVMTVITRGKNK